MTALCNPVSAQDASEIILSPDNSLNAAGGSAVSYGWLINSGENLNIDISKGYKGVAYRAGHVGADAVNSGIKYYPKLTEGEYNVYIHKFTGTGWGGIGWKINGKSGTVNYGKYYGGDLEYEWILLGSFDFGGEYMTDCVELIGISQGYSVFDAVRFAENNAKEVIVNPINDYNDDNAGYAVINGEYASKSVNSEKLVSDASMGYCGDVVQGVNGNSAKNDLSVTYYPKTDRAIYSVYTHRFKGLKAAGNMDLYINGIYNKSMNVGSYYNSDEVILKADNTKNDIAFGKTTVADGWHTSVTTSEGHIRSYATYSGTANQKMTFLPNLNAGKYDVYMAKYSEGDAWGQIKWTIGDKSQDVNIGAYNSSSEEYCINLGIMNAVGDPEKDSVVLRGTGGEGWAYFTALKFVRIDTDEVILKADNTKNNFTSGKTEWLSSEWVGETTDKGYYRSWGNGADTASNIKMAFRPELAAGKYNVYMAKYSDSAWGQTGWSMNGKTGTVNMGNYNSSTEEYCINLGTMEATGNPESDSVILSGVGGFGYAYLTALKFVRTDAVNFDYKEEWEYAGDFMFEGISGTDSVTLSSSGGGYPICDSIKLVKNETYDYSKILDYSTDSEEIKNKQLQEYNSIKSSLDLRKFLTKYKYGRTTFDSMYTKLLLNKKYASYNELRRGLTEFIGRVGNTKPIKIYSADGKETSKFDEGKIIFDSSEFAVSPKDAVFAAAYDKSGKLEAYVRGIENDGKYEFDFAGKECDKDGNYKILVWESFENIRPRDIYKTGIDIYVSPNGNGDGSIGSPAALKDVADIAKEYSGKEINVCFADGEYIISEPIVIADGAENIHFKGNGKTVISGAVSVSAWEAGGGMFKAYLPDISDMRRLYINGEPRTRAKSENLKVGRIYSSDGSGSYDSILVYNKDLSYIKGGAEAVFNIEWKNIRIPIKSAQHSGSNTVLTCDKSALTKALEADYAPSAPSANSTFYIENDSGLLDEKGEYFFDKASKILYYKPLDGETAAELKAEIPQSEGLIKILGTSDKKIKNISFENIVFKNSAYHETNTKGFVCGQSTMNTLTGEILPGSINVDFAENINIKNCEFRQLESSGINMENDVSLSTVTGCVFDNVSASAISIDDTDTGKSVNCRDIDISDNKITRIGDEYASSPALAIYYAGRTTAAHNEIHNIPYTAISVGWGWGNNFDLCRDNVIEYNNIYDYVNVLSDGAAVYTLGKMPNTKVRFNYIHGKCGNAYGALYADQASDEINFYKNVVELPSTKNKWLHLNEIIGITANSNYVNYDNHSNAAQGATLISTYIDKAAQWNSDAESIMDKAQIREENFIQ